MTIHDADPRDPFDRKLGPDDGPLHISCADARKMSAGRFDQVFGVRIADQDEVLSLTSRALGGDMTADTRLRMERLATRKGVALRPGFDETLRHHGVDPVAALALSLVSTAVSIGIFRADPVGGIRRIANLGINVQDLTWVRLGEGITWRVDAILLPRLPETIVTSLPGRRLGTVLSHPALDPMDLAITEVGDCWSDESMMEIVTSAHGPA